MSEERPSKKKHRRSSSTGLWIFIGLLALAGVIYIAGSRIDLHEFLNPGHLWSKVGRPILRTIVFISVGLLVGQLIESLGWTTRLGRLAWPLINYARLPGTVGASFTSAFVSGVLANTILYTGYQEGKLDRKSLVLANLLNASIPAYVLHMPTTLFIIISLTGNAGLIYVILTLAAAVLRLVGVSVISRFIMPPCTACQYDGTERTRSIKEVWAETWPKFRARIKRIIMIVIPVYIVVVMVAESGFFGWLEKALANLAVASVVPIESMSVIVFSVVAEFTSGFAAAGALLQAGTLEVREVVLALLIGNIVATPVRALRHQLPHYMGIYSPRLGAEMLAIGQIVRIISVVIVAAVFLLIY